MEIVAGSHRPWYPLPRAWRAHAASTPESVLLETAGGERDDHVSFFFIAPRKILRAEDSAGLNALLQELDAATKNGLWAAGAMSHEAGHVFERISARHTSTPLAVFGIFDEPIRFDHWTGEVRGPLHALVEAPEALECRASLSPEPFALDEESYAAAFEAIQRYIAGGDTYQVNFTVQQEWQLRGSILSLYEQLLEAQPVDFAAIVRLGGETALSFSPELFFRTKSGIISTRPMKGTSPRGNSAAEDLAQQEWLASDEKNRAEHLMIVDLLRNDMGRIAQPGSVHVESLFEIERYPALHQMTSTISAALLPETHPSTIFRALFPCGSITGAPKRRTMQLIEELEQAPRGIYTGAIGYLAPNGEACFNVAIRTLQLRNGRVRAGVGGGVIADSAMGSEMQECCLKASFLSAAQANHALFETMCWDSGFPLLGLHLERLRRSAQALGFSFNEDRIHAALEHHAKEFPQHPRVRLTLARDGRVSIECAPLTGKTTGLSVRVAARRLLSGEPALRHKTTRRLLYQREFERARRNGFDEVFFLNERDEVAEGSISNIFVQAGDMLFNPR